MPRSRNQAFTLAEVLIALALLGVVAAFSIPKIMQSTGNQRRNAVMKETIGTFSGIMQRNILNGEVTPNNFGTYLQQKLNFVNYCPTFAEPCVPATGYPNCDSPAQGTYVLPNGVILLGVDTNKPDWQQGVQNDLQFCIDANGLEGPNQTGSDRIVLGLCFGPATCSVYAQGVKPGAVGPGGSGTNVDINRTLWAEIFSQ